VLTGPLGSRASAPVDLLGLDEALEALAREDARAARLVELKFFGGFTLEAAAVALSVSKATAERDWSFAKAWLFHRLKPAPPRPR
jgi:DNA-directed RNA polymerase specialized sigma24 family protein